MKELSSKEQVSLAIILRMILMEATSKN